MKTTALTTLAVLSAACATMTPPGPAAIARLEPTKGNTAGGTVTFTQKGDKVVVFASVAGLSPGPHGSTFTKRAIAVRMTR